MKGKNNRRTALAAAITVYTIWGFSFMASDVAQRFVTPFTMLAYRFDIALYAAAHPRYNRHLGCEKFSPEGE